MKKLLFIFVIAPYFLSAKVDKIRLIYKQNGSFTVAWNQVSGSHPVVFYSDGKEYSNLRKLIHALKPYKSNKSFGMHTYFAEFKDLPYNSFYYFVIKDSQGESQTYWFSTFSTDTLSIVAGGDSRSYPEVRALADKMVGKIQPDLVIFDGDFTVASTPAQWQKWLDQWQYTIYDGRLIPLMVAEGNHERHRALQKLFDIPVHSYYAVSIADIAKIVILNSEFKPQKQVAWLEKQFADAVTSWNIAVYHKPMRPHYSKKAEGDDIYNAWAGIFYKYHVDMAIEGDTHVAKITYPIRPDNSSQADEGFVRDDVNGTIYLGEGTWGAPKRPADDAKSWTMDMASINQFKWIVLTESSAEIFTIKYDNEPQVAQQCYYKRYLLPAGIELWKPKGQKSVKIEK